MLLALHLVTVRISILSAERLASETATRVALDVVICLIACLRSQRWQR